MYVGRAQKFDFFKVNASTLSELKELCLTPYVRFILIFRISRHTISLMYVGRGQIIIFLTNTLANCLS